MRAGNITANELLIVGGLLAGAYIIYTLSETAKGAKDAISNGIDALSRAVDSGMTSVSNTASTIADSAAAAPENTAKNSTMFMGAGIFNLPLSFGKTLWDESWGKVFTPSNSAKAGSTQYVPPVTGNESFSQQSSSNYLDVFSNPAVNPTWAGDGLVFTRSSNAPLYQK